MGNRAFGACRHTPCQNVQLAKEGALKMDSVRHFILDECDKMLDKMGAHT